MTASSPTTLAKHELTDAECDVLTDILKLAQSHNAECRQKEHALRQAAEDNVWNWTDALGEYSHAVSHLDAAIAPAALARVKILAPVLGMGDLSILELEGEDLVRWLLPIFEDAGIADSFVLAREHWTSKDWANRGEAHGKERDAE